MNSDHRFAKSRKLERNGTIGMQAEGGTVEHHFVLATDLIQIDQRQAMLGDARHGDVEPDIVFVAPVR